MINPFQSLKWEEGMKLGEEVYRKLREWIPKRKEAAATLRKIALQLDEIKHTSTTVRVVGSSVAVAGGLSVVGAVAGTILTGGLATPLLVTAIAGTTAAVGGSATAGIAQLVNNYQSSDQMKEAKQVIEADTSGAAEIHQLMKKLENISKDVVSSFISFTKLSQYTLDDVVSSFVLAGAARNMGVKFKPGNFLLRQKQKDLKNIPSSPEIDEILKLFPTVMDNLKVIGKEAVGIVLLGGLGVAINVSYLVSAALDLAKGAKSEAGKQLSDAAEKIEDNITDINKTLDEIKKQLEKIPAEGLPGADKKY